MAFGDPINLRLSAAAEAEYTAEAARRTMPLRTLLRERLENGAGALVELRTLREEIEDLRRAVEARPAPAMSEASQADPVLVALQLEAVLLLRSLTGPDKVRSAHAEMRRRGVDPWT